MAEDRDSTDTADLAAAIQVQHWLMAGKMISLAISGSTCIRPENIRNLFIPDGGKKSVPALSDLAEFYDKHSAPLMRGRAARSLFGIFNPDLPMIMDPLTRSGHGPARAVSAGDHEMGLAFVYLAFHVIADSGNQLPEAIPLFLSVDNMIREVVEHANLIYEEAWDAARLGEELKNWLERCRQVKQRQQETELAVAALDTKMKRAFETAFWQGFSGRCPFLTYCIKRGHISRDDAAEDQGSFTLPKDFFVAGRTDSETESLGRDQGQDAGKFFDQRALAAIVRRDVRPERETTDESNGHTAPRQRPESEAVAEKLAASAAWLKERGCAPGDGIIVADSRQPPSSSLWNSDEFVPSWSEPEGTHGFDGSFRGYAVAWLPNRTSPNRFVAIDLLDWAGIHAGPRLLDDGEHGALTIRTWEEHEIERAVQEGKLEDAPDAKNRAKGMCPIGIRLFWNLDLENLPATSSFCLPSEDHPEAAS